MIIIIVNHIKAGETSVQLLLLVIVSKKFKETENDGAKQKEEGRGQETTVSNVFEGQYNSLILSRSNWGLSLVVFSVLFFINRRALSLYL